MITVEQFIKLLEKEDPKALVVIKYYEGYFDSLLPEVTEINIKPNVISEWYYGPHMESKTGLKAVLLKSSRDEYNNH